MYISDYFVQIVIIRCKNFINCLLIKKKRKGLRLDKDYYTLLFFEKRTSHLIEKYKCKETN